MKYIIILLFLFSCSSQNKGNQNLKLANIYYSKGTSELQKKNYTQAIINLKKANKLDINNSKILNNLGLAYLFKGLSKKAISYFFKSIKSDKKNNDAKINLAGAYFKTGKFKEAKLIYKKISKIIDYPHNYRTFYNLALIEKHYNRSKTYKNYLLLSIKENSNYCPTHYELSNYYKSTYQYKKALSESLKSSKGVCYQNPAPFVQQGVLYKIINNSKMAYNKFSHVIKKFPNSKYSTVAQTHLDNLVLEDPKLSEKLMDDNRKKLLETLSL